LSTISIDRIKLPDYVLRENMGDTSELQASIKEHGLLEPIVITPVEKDYEIVCGCRRYTALKNLGRTELDSQEYRTFAPAQKSDAFLLALTENIQRNSLTPTELGRAFIKYCKTEGYGSAINLAKKLAKDPSYITRYMALVEELPPEVQKRIGLGLDVSTAFEITRAPEPFRAEVSEAVIIHNFNRNETRGLVETVKANPVSGKDVKDLVWEYVKAHPQTVKETIPFTEKDFEDTENDAKSKKWDYEASPKPKEDLRITELARSLTDLETALATVDYDAQWLEPYPELRKEFITNVRYPLHNMIGWIRTKIDEIRPTQRQKA
jgi:ParB/RepB/Spo0J family partition protein